MTDYVNRPCVSCLRPMFVAREALGFTPDWPKCTRCLTEDPFKLALETLEWCEDFRKGAFSPTSHTPEGWPWEMLGLVADHERIARALLAEHEALGRCAEALEHLADAATSLCDDAGISESERVYVGVDESEWDALTDPLVRRALDDWRRTLAEKAR